MHCSVVQQTFIFFKWFFSQHIIMETWGIKDIRNLFRLKEETKAIKDKILRDIKYLFEHEEEEENYYKPE